MLDNSILTEHVFMLTKTEAGINTYIVDKETNMRYIKTEVIVDEETIFPQSKGWMYERAGASVKRACADVRAAGHGRLELPNVTKIAEHMGMTRGAISKMTKKLLTKGLIEKYTLESNKKEVYFKLTDLGKTLFEEHAKRHRRWEKRDMEFLSHYSTEDVKTVYRFMKEFNHYLEGQIEELS